MQVPTAFVHPARFNAEVARAAQRLGSHVVSVTPTLGSDWNGEPAVFFMVILSEYKGELPLAQLLVRISIP